LTTWALREGTATVLGAFDPSLRETLLIVASALVLATLLEACWLTTGKCAHVAVMASAYLNVPHAALTEAHEQLAHNPPKAARSLGWALTAAMALSGIATGVAFLEQLNLEKTVRVTAHRGSKSAAPENTLSALRQAIADQADYAEIDVQSTADGAVVLLHDADLNRVAGVDRPIHELSAEELAQIDVGHLFAEEFRGERVPSLQQTIDATRGRIQLNIELKYNRQDPKLVASVVEILQRNELAAECVVSSLNLSALEELSAALPEVPCGLIAFRSVGNITRMEVDFLSLDSKQISARLVRQAHRRGRQVHAWTVNDLHTALRLIEIGVDNLITDRPAPMRSLVDAWNNLSDSERITLMLRNLVADIEPKLPYEAESADPPYGPNHEGLSHRGF
jgi:glycerophosphoryl diester phosphodiesterase